MRKNYAIVIDSEDQFGFWSTYICFPQKQKLSDISELYIYLDFEDQLVLSKILSETKNSKLHHTREKGASLHS